MEKETFAEVNTPPAAVRRGLLREEGEETRPQSVAGVEKPSNVDKDDSHLDVAREIELQTSLRKKKMGTKRGLGNVSRISSTSKRSSTVHFPLKSRFSALVSVEPQKQFEILTEVELQIASGPKWKWARRCTLSLFGLIWLSLVVTALVNILRTPECKPTPKLRWWHKGPMYRIALQSFHDSNGNGIGDLHGIQRQMNYIIKLNMVAIIIGPIQIPANVTIKTDLESTDTIFGNIIDVKPFIKAAARHDLKVVLDLTPNPEENTWSSNYFDDHDLIEWRSRLEGHISSVIPKERQGIQDRLFTILTFTMPGTPIIYYGDEIGLKDYKTSVYPLMRWDNSKYAGFTKGLPWITADLDIDTHNVKQQSEEPLSTLSFYQALGKIRNEEPSLKFGDFHLLTNTSNLLAYIRHWDQIGILIILNFGATITFDFTSVHLPPSALLLVKSTDFTSQCQLIHLSDMVVEANIGYIVKYFISE
ncbi:amino acid transporter heavy chain SLC3A2-like [Heptranchias perlo]|uniref:amino acid transporter heavy chain SLC3A2-like n=1 Tax=Heptranchias perlo TaxID=212740 RepID=UPI0035599143